MRLLTALSLIFLFSTSAARSDDSIFSGVEGALGGGLGTDSDDVVSLSGALELGSDTDPHNVTGDFHIDYAASFAPQDPNLPQSGLKRLTDWVGGISADPLSSLTMGLDYDSSSDPYENLYSEGIRPSLTLGPLELSYRMARTTLRTSFTVPQSDPNQAVLQFNGAFIYQQTVEGSWKFPLAQRSSITAGGSASFFYPGTGAFASLLDSSTLISLANLQSALQSFELWDAKISWRQRWTDNWDSRASFQYSYLIIAQNPLVIGNLSVGYHWSHQVYTKLGFQYSADPLDYTATVLAEVRLTWERE